MFLSEEDGLVFKNYAIGISGKQVYVEGIVSTICFTVILYII